MNQNRTIILDATTYDYTLRQSQYAKRLRVSVVAGGGLAVSAPSWVSHRVIEHFLETHAEWIGEHIQRSLQAMVHPSVRSGRREYVQYRERARDLALSRLASFNQMFGFQYQRVSIRNQKTRWGSCSKQGNLSFNYRIALLPPALADYIILHELCHLGAFDHSAAFWSLVARAMPDYAVRRRTLRCPTAQQLS
jgi:predicted metal-dependent hydrolase